MLSCVVSSVHCLKPSIRHRTAAWKSSLMLQSRSRRRSPRAGREEWDRAAVRRKQVSSPLPWTLNTAEGASMRSPQSECKVHSGDLDQVRLTEKHRGLSLHNPAGTGSAPAAPGLQLPQKGPVPGVLSRAWLGCVAHGRRSACPVGTAWAAPLPPQPAGRWRVSPCPKFLLLCWE